MMIVSGFRVIRTLIERQFLSFVNSCILLFLSFHPSIYLDNITSWVFEFELCKKRNIWKKYVNTSTSNTAITINKVTAH